MNLSTWYDRRLRHTVVRHVALVLVLAVGLTVAGCGGSRDAEPPTLEEVMLLRTRPLGDVMAEVEVGDDIHVLGEQVAYLGPVPVDAYSPGEVGQWMEKWGGNVWPDGFVELISEGRATGCWRFGVSSGGGPMPPRPPPPWGGGIYLVCHRDGEVLYEPVVGGPLVR